MVALAICIPSGQSAMSELCTRKDPEDANGSGLRIKCLGTKNRITTIKQLELGEVASEISFL